jgi:O-antigen/teichoic acid export membrane protein
LPLVLNYFSIQIPFYPYFFLAIIINFFDVISIIPLVAYRVDEDARSFVVLSVGRTILQYLLVIVFVAYFKMGLLGSYLGRLAGSLPFGIIYFLILKKKGIFSFNFKLIKKALYFSLPLLPGVLSYLLISMLDRIILERYVTLKELGLYSVAATLTLTLNIVIQALYKTFEQKIFREHGSEGYPALLNKLYKIYIVSLFIPGFILSLFVKEILLFFTSSQYYSAYQYVVYLVIAVIISGMNTFFGTLLIADNRKKVVAWSSVISAVLSVVANLILIKSFGVLGACIGSILSFLFVYIFYLCKVVLINKFIAQQISFIAIFLASGYLIPDSTSMFVSIIAKLALFVSFLLFIKMAIHIRLSSVQNLVFSKVKQRRDRS